MSSDSFHVRIVRVDGPEVVLDLLTSGSGEVDDCKTSRSFALLLLADALPRAQHAFAHTPRALPAAERVALAEALKAAPLAAALDAAEQECPDWSVSAKWMEGHVGTYVAATELVERRNAVGDDELFRREAEIDEQFGGELTTDRAHEWMPVRWERSHNYTLRVVLTDPKWASHLRPGLEFGTTAFDVWWE